MSRREKNIVSLLGEVHLKRAYYHCRHCHSGHVPLDQETGLTAAHLTPATAEVVCITGVQTSFAEASEITLRKVAGLRLSESTVERTTEAAGARLGALLAKGKTFAAPEPWEWHRDACGRTVAYVSGDATGVRQQGAQGAKVEGRMAWVGMFYNPRGASWTLQRRTASTPDQVRYGPFGKKCNIVN